MVDLPAFGYIRLISISESKYTVNGSYEQEQVIIDVLLMT